MDSADTETSNSGDTQEEAYEEELDGGIFEIMLGEDESG